MITTRTLDPAMGVPGMSDGVSILVSDFVWRAATDRAVVLFEAHSWRNFIHIRNVTSVLTHGISRLQAMKDRAYIVGLPDANLSKLELCQRIQADDPRFCVTEAPTSEDPEKQDDIVSNARIEASGFTARFPLDHGIKELNKCYQLLLGRPHANI